MSLVIRGARHKGILAEEKIVLVAEADMDIGQYILFDTTYISDSEISSKVRHSFWLPDFKVDAGDLVVVYTKDGTQKQKTNEDQSKTLFLYWGLGRTVWNQGEDCAVLVKVDGWSMKRV